MDISELLRQEFPNGFKKVKHLETIKDKTHEVFIYHRFDGNRLRVETNCKTGEVIKSFNIGE